MKSVKSLVKWILFVPVCIMSVALTVISGSNPELAQNFLATDINGIAEIIAFSVLGLFLLCFVLSLFDRTTSPVHLLRKNYFCGITAFVTAFALAATAALDATTMIQLNNITVMGCITALFAALSGISLLFIGINHFSGANTPKSISVFYLVLPLWCGVHLIDRFLKHTATPVDAADTLDLIMFVALAMFFINATMIHSIIPGKNAVKSAVTFGFPAVVISLVYGISLVFNVLSSDSTAFIDYIPALGYCLIGLYVLGFTAELSFKAKSVEEQKVLEPSKESDEDNTQKEIEEITQTVCDNDQNPDEVSSDDRGNEVPFVNNINVVNEDIQIFDDEKLDEYESEYDEDADQDMNVDVSVNLPELDSQYSEDGHIAEELFRDAQQMDLLKDNDKVEATAYTESEENMFIDGKGFVTPVKSADTTSSDSRPKGPTSREAVMYDDEDFILAIDVADSNTDAPVPQREDISSFILENSEETEISGVNVEKTYANRLDEIDQLIISIQGGGAESEE